MFGGIRYKIYSLLPFPEIKPAKTKSIDVVVPVIKKDLGILPLCLQGIRMMINHPIKNIYIVAPPLDEIIIFCRDNNLRYVDESTILDFTPKDINLIITNPDGSKCDRSGWLFQQLVKLSGKIGTCDNYLCIDSDHILIRPHTFIANDDKEVFYMSNERNKDYFLNIYNILEIKPLALISYVSHKMIFNKEHIFDLQKQIEAISGKNWIETIISNYDRSKISGFSEFELYGNFIKNKDKYKRPWRELSLSQQYLLEYNILKEKYSDKYWSITFPAYL